MDSRAPLRVATVLVASGLFAASALAGAAQDSTPHAGMEGMAGAHPAHIHIGPCDQLDPNPTFMLTDVAPIGAEASGSAIPVEGSRTTVDSSLADLLAGGYAINVHKSAEEIGTYIACGDLGDAADAGSDQTLTIGLRELNDSGYAGIAILTGNGDATVVNVYLAQGLSGDGEDAAAAESGATEAAANAVAVDIVDFAYSPDPIEIAVGDAVTWTNGDTAPHTATARDRALLQSGTIAAGDSFTQTFDQAGTIEYFCEFHSGMKGTIVVN